MKKIAAILSLTALLSACQSAALLQDTVLASDDTISLVLTRSTKFGNDRVIYGRLSIHNRHRAIAQVDLSCFSLARLTQTSKSIAVDSIASVLTSPYPADADGTVHASVYWAFSGPAESSLQDYRLSYNENYPGEHHCISYR